MGQHTNPSSRYKNRKNHYKKIDEQRRDKKKYLDGQKKEEKKQRKQRKKISPNFPEEYNLINTDNNDTLFIRIPVKWTLFGKLHKTSNILLDNVLSKNIKAVFGINPKLDPNTIPPMLYLVKQKALWKRDIKLRKPGKEYSKKSLRSGYDYDKMFTYKHHKTWYIYIKIDIKAIWDSNACWYMSRTNYIELRTHVYDHYPISRFKIKNVDNRCHLALAVVRNRDNLKNKPTTVTLNNIYPKVIKSKTDKDVNCIYRIYLNENHDIADPEIIRMSSHVYDDEVYVNNGLYIYAIPNVVRYRRSFNIEKLPYGKLTKKIDSI